MQSFILRKFRNSESAFWVIQSWCRAQWRSSFASMVPCLQQQSVTQRMGFRLTAHPFQEALSCTQRLAQQIETKEFSSSQTKSISRAAPIATSRLGTGRTSALEPRL